MSSMVQTMIGSATGAPSSGHIALAARLSQEEACGNGLVAELRGVPKPALTAVMGNELGERVWRHARGKVRWPEGAIADAEIATGLVRHLCRQAAADLQRANRHAKFVRLTVWYGDGGSKSERTRLPQLTQDADEIAVAAVGLLGGSRLTPALVRSVDLDVTAVSDAVAEPVRALAWFAGPARTAPA